MFIFRWCRRIFLLRRIRGRPCVPLPTKIRNPKFLHLAYANIHSYDTQTKLYIFKECCSSFLLKHVRTQLCIITYLNTKFEVYVACRFREPPQRRGDKTVCYWECLRVLRKHDYAPPLSTEYDICF